MEEIVKISRMIQGIWKRVALLTNLFETYEIDEINISRVNEEETRKAVTMLTRYMEREGTRQRLAGALEKFALIPLSQDVRSGYFINTGEEE